MEKDKTKKPKNQQDGPPEGGNEEDINQAMVALTFDEYEALEKELDALRVEVEEQKDSWLRTRADFDNYKKRVLRDSERSQQDALTNVLKLFLGAVDDLELALKNQPQNKDVLGWINGIELIHQKLLNQMKNLGVERMDIQPGDAFDPNIHEAITQEEHPEYKDEQIIEIIQPGYKISDRIIRPAMVRVAQ